MSLSLRTQHKLLTLTTFSVLGLLGCAQERASRPAPESTEPQRVQEEEVVSESGSPLPPLVIDMDEPLLLDAADTVAETEVSGADNGACLVCHMNFDDETLARNHASHEIGCVACHGDSFAHRNDENNTTPPETMFPAKAIDPFCQKCHKTHDVVAREIIRLWQAKAGPVADPDAITCTDCHGEHRIKVRTVIWDKATGKLLPNKL